MAREYPGFIIDRTRRSEKRSDDYVVCADDEVGFIAKVYQLKQSQIDAHNARVAAMSPEDADTRFVVRKISGRTIVILEVVHLLHPPLVMRSKMQSLMKKALKTYLYGETKAVMGDGSSIDMQIAIVAEMRDKHLEQRKQLEENMVPEVVDLKIATLNEAVASLEMLKQILSFNGKTRD